MLYSSSLRNWKYPTPAARLRTRTSPRERAAFRPQLEALEGRTLLALPYPVASTVSELVADINYANNTGGAFTINLNPSNDFELSTYLPVVGGGGKAVDLTILGNGGAIERVSLQSHNLVSVAAGASLTLDDVTLQGGYVASGLGGAIYNGGTLTVRDSTLSGNHVSGSSAGGAIFNNAGTVTVSGSTFTANYADGGHGGAIYNGGGVVTVSDSRFFGNWARTGAYTGGGEGGGIYNSATGTLIVRDSSSISGNYGTWFDQGSHSSDVHNYGMVYQDNTSTIYTVHPNPAIVHDSNTPQLWIHDVNVVEGNTGTTSATFTVILTAGSTQPVSVAYSTGAGAAIAGSDYQTTSGTLTFAPGESSKTITVPVYGERVAEPDETFSVNLSAPINATIGDAQGIGTILDDEPRISIDDVTRTEGSKGTTYFTFTVALSVRSTTPLWSPNTYDQTVTVSFRTHDGTATTGNRDYSGKSHTLSFRPGESRKTITIAVKGDRTPEADETFKLQLFGASSNASLLDELGIGTILNDD
jgi:hypothetical protein